MKKRELLARIEELEREVAELRALVENVPMIYLPFTPMDPMPVTPIYPQLWEPWVQEYDVSCDDFGIIQTQ